MLLTRRYFLAASAALAPARLWAGTEVDLGAGRQIFSLSDGHLELPPEFVLGGMPADRVAALRKAHGLPDGPLIAPCNLTLMRDGTNTVLFDAGAGPDFQTTAGQLQQALDLAGVSPHDVTHVIFTHGHPDHLWGVLDDFEEPLFDEARHIIGGDEFDYWTDPATVDTIGEARLSFAAGAKRRLEVMSDLFERIGNGDSPVPGVTARLTPGHTPGHLAYDLGDVFVTGDCISNPHIAFDDPGYQTASDQDPPRAAETRALLMDALAASGQPILGFHLPGGGIGTVQTSGAGFRFVPT